MIDVVWPDDPSLCYYDCNITMTLNCEPRKTLLPKLLFPGNFKAVIGKEAKTCNLKPHIMFFIKKKNGQVSSVIISK